MYRTKRHGIFWSLERGPWMDALLALSLPREERRPHLILEYPGGSVFVKFFRERGIIPFFRNLLDPRGRKEYLTATRLLSLSLPTPRPIGFGRGRHFSCSVQQWVEGADFSTLVRNGGATGETVRSVASLLAVMAERKVRHDDFHGGNILFAADGRPSIIDLHAVRITSLFGLKDEVANMCHVLYGLYDSLSETEKKAFFEAYGRPGIRRPVEEGLALFADRWVKRKKKRAFRSTSRLLAREHTVVVRGRENAARGEQTGVIKKDRKTVVLRHTDHVRKIYTNTRRLRRAWLNYVVLLYMEKRVVPEPYFVRKPTGRQKGFVAMEDLAGYGEELDTFLDRRYDGLTYGARMSLVKGFSAFLVSLFQARIGHRDMKACNFFCLHDGGFRLLDVEDICFEGAGVASLRRMFLQLNLSVPARITTRDRLTFFSLTTRGIAFDRKALLREVWSASREGQIQYVGLNGTVREIWKERERRVH